MATWQQILALDARYNAYRVPSAPGFRTLYIRRRSQLLREGVKEEWEPALRRQYLRQRAVLLTQRYGVISDQCSVRSRSISVQSHSRHHSDVGLAKLADSASSPSPAPGLVPSARATASQAIVGGGSLEDNYAFAGFLHVFDQHDQAVTCVRFAHDELALLACGSLDGRVSVCDLDAEQKVKHLLRGHTDGVTGLEWSTSNDFLVSCSRDATARLWSAADGRCLRTVSDSQRAPLSCLCSHPINSNLGAVVSFRCDQGSGRLVKCCRVTVSDGAAITCLSVRSWVSREAADMSLLVNSASNALLLYRVMGQDGNLQLRRRFHVRHTMHTIKSSFCPIMSFRQGACVVSGSEDCAVYLFDVERQIKPCVNKLQGHSAAVLDVCFNVDESLLATADAAGTVIVWKRQL